MSKVHHGGRLDAAVAEFGGKRERWLDLSTGINPNGYPLPEIDKEIWRRLPDDDAFSSALAAARKAYDCADDCAISLGAGTQAHIQALPRLFKPQSVAIVGFTYQEHGVQWAAAGHEVYVTDGLESAEATARIVIVVNPNNPDGRIVDREPLIGLARRLAAKGGLLIVDEAFADVAPVSSVASECGREGLLVLRSVGKFYGLGGIRFGAALGHELICRRLDKALGPWAVSGPALIVGEAALRDTGWRNRMRKKLAGAREDLENVLVSHGFQIVGGTDLFVLIRHRDADSIWKHLASNNILTRSFPGKQEWLRLGLPGKKSALNRLDAALGKL
ncbi:MAG: threonine-phosphate decarboxylase CobD [Pseudomonadota bacterium]